MKGFRRFGGEFSGNGDTGNYIIATIGIITLVLCCAAALAFARPEFVALGFILLFAFTLASTFFGGSIIAKVRKQRLKKQLFIADLQYEAKNYIAVVKAIDKARISGEVPVRYEQIYELSKSKC